MPITKTIVFPGDIPPARLDSFTAISLKEISRSQIKNLIQSGMVKCGGNVINKPSYKLSQGEKIIVTIPDPVETSVKKENIPIDIIYQDKDIAVINKQTGLTVHPAGKILSGTLVNALMYHIKDLSGINGELRPGIVHRLDKNTSGLIIIAKNDISHRIIAQQFEERTIEKKYIALAWGIFQSNTGEITKSITRSRVNRQKMISGRSGKQSKTLYRIIEEFDFLSLLELYPKTGRTHQIRSHLESIGHPVFGDDLYRGRKRRVTNLYTNEKILANRLLKMTTHHILHAAEISLTHPSSGDRVTFKAEMPEDFANILNELRMTN
ncbi:RluA family pseudouridine synthase [candidate division KSB1 bacterium]